MSLSIHEIDISLIRGDITEQTTDAIVNAANSHLAHGGGVALAIARKAGEELLIATRDAPEIPTGEVYTTPAGNLPCQFVIHAVGPVWRGGSHHEDDLLASAVRNALQEATTLNLQSLSFPAISTGIYGFPLDRASTIILRTIITFCHSQSTSLRSIVLVLFAEHDLEVFRHSLKNLTDG